MERKLVNQLKKGAERSETHEKNEEKGGAEKLSDLIESHWLRQLKKDVKEGERKWKRRKGKV